MLALVVLPVSASCGTGVKGDAAMAVPQRSPTSTTTTTTTTTTTPLAAAPTATAPALPRPQRVTVIGDSLTVQATEELREAAAPTVVDIHARVRTTVADWTPFVAGIVERSRSDVLVIALGTNDNLQGEHAGFIGPDGAQVPYGRRIATMLRAAAGAPCLVWVQPSGHAMTYSYLFNAAVNNYELSAVLARHHVPAADWDHRMTTGHAYRSEWMTVDAIHLTDLGQQVYADFITDAVAESCPPPEPGS